jgi:hypothetical protein
VDVDEGDVADDAEATDDAVAEELELAAGLPLAAELRPADGEGTDVGVGGAEADSVGLEGAVKVAPALRVAAGDTDIAPVAGEEPVANADAVESTENDGVDESERAAEAENTDAEALKVDAADSDEEADAVLCRDSLLAADDVGSEVAALDSEPVAETLGSEVVSLVSDCPGDDVEEREA